MGQAATQFVFRGQNRVEEGHCILNGGGPTASLGKVETRVKVLEQDSHDGV
jgi:hypothetical protein